jgi:hypothetical protein
VLLRVYAQKTRSPNGAGAAGKPGSWRVAVETIAEPEMIDTNKLLSLIAAGESEIMEFKRDSARNEQLAKEPGALANYRLFGILRDNKI